jgi:hypothetical protein
VLGGHGRHERAAALENEPNHQIKLREKADGNQSRGSHDPRNGLLLGGLRK